MKRNKRWMTKTTKCQNPLTIGGQISRLTPFLNSFFKSFNKKTKEIQSILGKK